MSDSLRLLTMTWTSTEDAWASLAEVFVSPERCKKILLMRADLIALQAKYDNLVSIEAWDSTVIFYNDVDVLEVLGRELERKLEDERLIPRPHDWDESAHEVSRTSCDRIVLQERGFYWVASCKYTSARVESELIPYSMIEAILPRPY